MSKQKQTAEEMHKLILETLHFRGLKRMLSNRKNPDGTLQYQEAIEKVKKAEDEWLKYK